MLNKKFIGDVTRNMIASALPIIILQLFVLPQVASKLGAAQYGLMLTIISCITLVSVSIGNALNNTRLLWNARYEEEKCKGDFNILVIASAVINVVVLTGFTILYSGFGSLVATVIAGTLQFLQPYLLVKFRIDLNYRAIVLNQVILVIGYLVGLILFYATGIWQWIYIVGYASSVVYINSKGRLLREPMVRTRHFRDVRLDTARLTCATLLGAALTYADKLLIYPILGGSAVSIYYAATIVGKICAMAITPMNSVMLSYLAKMKTIRTKPVLCGVAILAIFAITAYFICIAISPSLLEWAYPAWAKESLAVVGITTATAMINVVTSVIKPIVIRFCNLQWQIYINAMSLFLYVAVALWLVPHFGLKGFCVAVLVVAICNLIMFLSVFFVSQYKFKRS